MNRRRIPDVSRARAAVARSNGPRPGAHPKHAPHHRSVLASLGLRNRLPGVQSATCRARLS